MGESTISFMKIMRLYLTFSVHFYRFRENSYMTSKRMLKKKISSVVNNIIEECYSIQILGQGKVNNETNEIIDEAVEIFDDMLSRVNAARSIEDKKELRKHFESINTDFEKESLSLMGKMDKL